MGDLGKRPGTGKVDNTNPVFAGGWTVTFNPELLNIRVEAEVYHIAIKGPAGSTFQVFIDDTFYDNVERGDINSWDPNQCMPVNPGDTVYFYWNTAANPAPKVTIYLRERSRL